jgi:NhaP-type Na+/H+ or K+/H+ antiporter
MGNVPDPTDSLSALPSTAARVMAFISILIGGLAGGLIGYSLIDVQCDGDCGLPLGLGILTGSVLSAGGTAIVSVLVLRALGEWREMADRSSR